MTKHKHTPGPWDVEHDTEIIAAEGKWIAEADTRSINFVNGEATANAHLIAAAPDLLRACEVALERADMGGAVRAMLTDAVKKARGGA